MTVMHIGEQDEEALVHTLCGLTLDAGDGAALDDPWCETCTALASHGHPWTQAE